MSGETAVQQPEARAVRIRGWAVDGFGNFRDYEEASLPAGLVAVYGRNEAGKSTLLAFLRGVLFGFPDGRSRAPRYEPLHGGRHGGRVLLEAPAGEWLVDREAGGRRVLTVTTPAGPGDEAELYALLGGADATLFRNVFAFGLQELQELRTLSDDAVRSRIYAAGLVGAGRSAREVADALKTEGDALFVNSRSYTREIPKLRSGIEGAERALRDARAALREHPRLLEEEQATVQEVVDIDAAGGALTREEARLRLLLELWPVWQRRVEAELELEAEAPVEHFPAGAEVSLERALAGVAGAAEQERAALERWRELCGERRRLGRSAGATAEVVELVSAEGQLGDRLRELGPGWDEARLAGFDGSLPRQATIRGWEKALQEADAAVHAAEQEVRDVGRRRADAESAYRRARQRAEQLPAVDAAALAGEEAALRRLRAGYAELRAAEAGREAQAQLAGERERALGSAAATAAAAPPWGRWARWAAAAGAAAFLAAMVLVVIVGAVAAAGAAVMVAVALMAGALVLRAAARAAEAEAARGARLRAEQERELAAVQERVAWLDGAIAALRDAQARDAAALGLALPLSAADIEERAGVAQTQREALGVRARALADADAAAHAAEGAAGLEAEAVAHLEAARDTASAARAEWAHWREAAGLPALAPAAALDFLRAVHDGLASLRQRDAARDRLAALRDALRRDQHSAAGAVRRARAAAAGAAGAVATLYAEAGAAGEAEFRTRLAAYERRGAMRARIRELDRQIGDRIGGDAAAVALREELAAAHVQEWRERRAALEAELAALASRRDDAIRRNQDASRRREELEQSADVPALETRRNGLRAELAALARRWTVVTLARALVEETLERYVRERQPGVLRVASERFSAVTDGRYTAVLQDREGESFVVQNRAGRTLGPEQLSRGTAEQLYLALRLALAEEFSRHGAALPLVMDDVLVNFDHHRARATARVLARVAERHQVLVFTCHRSTARLLRQHGAAVLGIG